MRFSRRIWMEMKPVWQDKKELMLQPMYIIQYIDQNGEIS
jgi:hypothetical protein